MEDREDCLNPFSIRASLQLAEFVENNLEDMSQSLLDQGKSSAHMHAMITAALQVSIPSRSGQVFRRTRARYWTRANCLNPFSIRASLQLRAIAFLAENRRLNPFSIRASLQLMPRPATDTFLASQSLLDQGKSSALRPAASGGLAGVSIPSRSGQVFSASSDSR